MDEAKREKVRCYLNGEAAGFARVLRIKRDELTALKRRLVAAVGEIEAFNQVLTNYEGILNGYREGATSYLECPRCYVFGNEAGYLVEIPHRYATALQCPTCRETYEIMV